MYNVFTKTQKGKKDSGNEDRVLVNKTILGEGQFNVDLMQPPILLAVADGVGGNNGGETASHMTTYLLSWLNDISEVSIEFLKQYISDINNKICNESDKHSNLNKMATTLSGLLICNDHAFLFHIGNCRIYLLQKGYLKQITDDHTTLNWMLKKSLLTSVEAIDFPKKNEITACIGAGKINATDQLQLKDITEEMTYINKILICSDGVHDFVEIDDLESYMTSSENSDEICDRILDKAVENGSRDDLSIIICDITNL